MKLSGLLGVLVLLLAALHGATGVVARDLGAASDREAISISVKDGDLAEVLRLLARVGRFNLVLDPAVSGRTMESSPIPACARTRAAPSPTARKEIC